MKIKNYILVVFFGMFFPVIVFGQKSKDKIQNDKFLNETIAFSEAGDYEKALSILKQLIRAEKDKTKLALYYNDMGSYQSSQKKYRVAIKSFGLAIRANPTLIMSYKNRAALYVKLKDNYHALTDYTTALKIDSTDKDMLKARSIILRDMESESQLCGCTK
jgi:tetratricopeptide (TPR) repeat protein